MGTRTRYEIGPIPSVILISDSEHADESPEHLFRDMVRDHGLSLAGLTRALLNAVYRADNGVHRAGDPIFTIEIVPTEYSKVLSVDYPDTLPVITEKPGFA